jgi:FkbM family methyltransferase
VLNKAFRKLQKAFRLSLVPLYRHGLRQGVGAAIEHEAILASLSRDDVSAVVDIGANCGQFSLLCRRWLPNASIYAFEPLRRPGETFRRIFEKDPDTRLIQAAIGAASAEREMHVSKSVDSSSLLPIGPTQSAIFPGTEESHRETVRVAPLDAFLGREDLSANSLLKIDVQGYELEVLKGCESLLEWFYAVYVECSFVELYEGQSLAQQVIDWLHGRGLYLARIGLVSFDKAGMSVLFLRREA